MRLLVAAFGLAVLVVSVVVIMPPGLLHVAVTRSMPEVEQDCATTLCGAPMRPAAPAVAFDRLRSRKPNPTTSRLRRCPCWRRCPGLTLACRSRGHLTRRPKTTFSVALL